MMPQSGGAAGVVPTLNAADLAAASLAGYLPHTVNVIPIALATIPGANLTSDHIDAVLEAVQSRDCDGAVVTQGTDVLEETSFYARLRYGGSVPIVFTGAMLSPDRAGSDGPANLCSAASAALSGGMPPVSLLMDGVLHDPALVRKTHTSSPSSFSSNGREIGNVRDGVIDIKRAPLALQTYEVHHTGPRAIRIGLAPSLFDAPADILDIFQYYDGLIVAAFGVGHVSEAWADRLESLAAKIPVILASRCDWGSVHRDTYGFKGSEADLIVRGLEPAGHMDSLKARIALKVIMIANASEWRHHFKQLRQAIDTHIAGALD